MSIANTRLGRHLVAASAVALGVSGSAGASVVHWDCNLSIPANVDGLYINVEARTSGATGGSVSGWDINAFGTTSLQFSAGVGAAYVAATAAATPSSLPVGTVVSASSTYSTSTASIVFGSAGWTLNAPNFLGFRFQAADGLTHYAIGRMDVGASASVRTLAYVEYESVAGAPITVPAPGALALLATASGICLRRRR
jgi:hypothetical protein